MAPPRSDQDSEPVPSEEDRKNLISVTDKAAAAHEKLLSGVVTDAFKAIIDPEITPSIKILLILIILCVLFFSMETLVLLVNFAGAAFLSWSINPEHYLIIALGLILLIIIPMMLAIKQSTPILNTIEQSRTLSQVTTARQIRGDRHAA